MIKKIIPQKIKNFYHLCQAILANFIYGFPSRKIKVIGITGTNGKTTTAQMVAKILEGSGAKVAMASTINFKLAEKEWVNKTKFTTLSSFSVQKFIKQAIEGGCEYLILETSSHSLDQYRVWGVKYDVAVITNVTREHLDYHKTMAKYRQAKRRIFRQARVAVVNLDMEEPGEYLGLGTGEKYGYTANDQKSIANKQEVKVIRAENIELGMDHSSYQIGGVSYKIKLPGLFNIENALAATSVGLAYGISLEKIKTALEKIKGVSGRMEFVPNDRGVNILIDYALTPDSLEKLYRLVGTMVGRYKKDNQTESKIIAVFGSCGERDRGKRPIMGEIVSQYADYIILTNEDPYREDPWQIINEVAVGIKNKKEGKTILTRKDEHLSSRPGSAKLVRGGNFWRILDRREAIEKALVLAEKGDFVVITGKGAEEAMAIGKKMVPWNDKEVINEILEEFQ